MTIYPMQHDVIPQGVIEEVEKLQRDFIWGATEGKKVWHALAWNNMCKTKAAGGVGIKSLRRMNEAFLLKLLWRMYEDPDSLWAKTLLGKYDRKKLWKEICNSWKKFSQQIVRHQDNGRCDLIWKANASGSFTTGSAYEILQESPEVNARSIWSKIWKIKVPESPGFYVESYP